MQRTLALLASIACACGGDEPGDDAAPPADAGGHDAAPSERPLTIADVVAPVTEAELELVRDEWAGRDLAARDVQEVASGTLMLGDVEMGYRVLEHGVEGARHHGVVLVPTGLTGPAPVLVYAHGGFTGEGGLPPFAVEDLALRIPGQPLRGELVYVVPAYRGERISVAGTTYTSEGVTLIGTTDLTDTAALLSAATGSTPQADPARVAVFGESRGGLVALALAGRDERVDLVIDAFGPTDFRIGLAGIEPAVFDASVAAAVAAPTDPANLLTRSLVPIEQVTVKADSTLAITPEGYTELRRRMAATSALANASELPVTQVHHGTADTTASVEYSRALSDAMARAGRPSPSETFTYHEYEGGAHSLDSLAGALDRIAGVIDSVLAP